MSSGPLLLFEGRWKASPSHRRGQGEGPREEASQWLRVQRPAEERPRVRTFTSGLLTCTGVTQSLLSQASALGTKLIFEPFFFFFLSSPLGLWDFSSLMRAQTLAPGSGNMKS